MNFSNHNVETVTKHQDTIAFIHQFKNNDSDHYVSISLNSELVEWIWSKQQKDELSRCLLERPKDKFLQNIGHTSYNSENSKISKVLCYENRILCGYEDGLILVWTQCVENVIF
jgi:hypothetical protein